jgi:beta-phosphoglucomutase
MKEYLALFDLDGTLFDTREVNFCSYKDALLSYGFILEREYFDNKCFGRNYKEFLPEIMQGTENIEKVHKEKKELYTQYLGKARINKHLFNIIDKIKEDYYIAVVTTASKKNTMDILCYFGYQDYFDYIITQEDIRKKKPDPECFYLAMKHFKTDATHTVIFEDSPVGIEAAKATGATVLVINKM